MTMTSNKLRGKFLTFPQDVINPEDIFLWDSFRIFLQEYCLPNLLEVLTQLLSFILPSAEMVQSVELIWAYTVVDTCSVGDGKGALILAPLFDMMNHCPRHQSCTFLPGDPRMAPMIAKLNTQTGPANLRVAAGPGGAKILTRNWRTLGRLDECLCLAAGSGGLRAGAEASYVYADIASYPPYQIIEFALDYGFYPVEGAAPRGDGDGDDGTRRAARRRGPVFPIDDGVG